MMCMYWARPCSFHSFSRAWSGVADTVISSTSGYIATIASRTPGNGPQPCTMSAIIALTPLPQRMARSIVSDGCFSAKAAMPLSERGYSDSMNSVSSGYSGMTTPRSATSTRSRRRSRSWRSASQRFSPRVIDLRLTKIAVSRASVEIGCRSQYLM